MTISVWFYNVFLGLQNYTEVMKSRAEDLLTGKKYSGTQEHLDLQVLIADLNAYITGYKYRRSVNLSSSRVATL